MTEAKRSHVPRRPTLHPWYACMEHWQDTPCSSCLYDSSEWRDLRPRWWAVRWRLRRFIRRNLGWAKVAYDQPLPAPYDLKQWPGAVDAQR